MSKDTGRRKPRTAGPTTSTRTADPVPDPGRGSTSPQPSSSRHPVPTLVVTAPRSPEGHPCPFCDRTFSTKIGLGVHKRSAHPDEANAEVNVERVKRQWSEEEMRLMAREEALAARRNVRFMNQHLLTVVPERSLEAIKGMRRNARYRDFVATALETLSGASSDGGSYRSLASEGTGEDDVRSAVEGESRTSTPTSWRSTDYDHRTVMQDLMPIVSAIEGWDSSGLVGIARGHLEGCRLEEDCIARWIAGVFPPTAQRNQPPPYRVVNPGRKLIRRMEYSRVQRMFRSNMSRCVKSILDGEKGGDEVVPDVETMSRHWGPFVSRLSPPVPQTLPTGPKPGLQYLWDPITVDEVARVNLPLSSAPGIDTITVRQWRAVPSPIKALLFNTVLAMGGFPPSMLVSRTVFISKKCDSPSPANFRPISVMSVVVRHLHKILAQRLGGSGLIDLRQRCFDDGCSENVAVLASVILEARTKLRELHVASLDVAKAFDSVSHGAVISVMEGRGLPMGLIGYISRLYSHSYTVFEIRGCRSEPVKINRGVRQGDPLSPFLFCLVVDRIMGAVPPDVGFRMGGTLVDSLAFADDVLLISATKWGLQTSLGLVEDMARDQGLAFNAQKCSVLSIVPAGKQKKFKIQVAPTFRLRDGSFLPQLSTTAEWRYLGVNFQPSGPRSLRGDLTGLLDNLTRAPLKPQQRLKALRCFLVPRFYHGLVLGRANIGRLRALDLQVRAAVRRWLRLPHDTSVGFFHASVRDGGLGVPSFITTIPGLTIDRFKRLGRSTCPAVRAVFESAWVLQRLRCAERVLGRDGTPLSSADRRREWWSRRLHQSVDGRELAECPKSTLSSWWLDAGSLAVPGRDFVQYVHVWINCLPTLIRTTRGTRRTSRPIHCRAGCNVTETAAHVIQQCHRTHGGRVKRHDAVANTAAAALRSAGWTVEQEPVLDTDEGRRKPDLVCSKGGEVHVVDAQIVSGATSLDDAHERKRSYYGNNNSLKRTLSVRYATDSVRFSSCTLSWRGIWSSRSADALLHMGLTKGLLRGITTRVLQGSHTNWTRWNQMTTVVRRGAPEPRTGIG